MNRWGVICMSDGVLAERHWKASVANYRTLLATYTPCQLILTRSHKVHIYIYIYIYISPVLKSSTVEFDNYQNIFVRHFASQSIVTSGVLAKYRSFLWNWTPSHIQRIYKGQNSKNPLRAITFDWSVLRTWGRRLWTTFLMLFSGIPHLPTLRDTWHVTYVTHVTHVTWHMWHTRRDKR